jgi:SAM-dependent methyltransferase
MRKNIFDNSQIWNWIDSNENNKERYLFTEQLTPPDVASIVDLGCGHGSFLKLISSIRADIRCVGVDNSDGALGYVQVEKKKASITEVPYDNNEFDCVCALEVLEHLGPEDFKKALGEMTRLSKKYIIVSSPYKEDIEWNMVKCPSCKTIFHYDGHVQTFDEGRMENLFKEYGFKCVSSTRLGWSEHYKFHKSYIKAFYPHQILKTPHYTVCPVCNMELQPNRMLPGTGDLSQPDKSRKTLMGIFKGAVKAFWPKERKSYWIIGLYKRQ